jgi:DNA polymerase I
MLLHDFSKKNFVMPTKTIRKEYTKKDDNSDLKGATVLEPDKGLHSDGCVLVLDFKSLYPSIMRTYNISPDTMILDKKAYDYNEAPNGARFVKESVRRGIFPELLQKLIEARRLAKKEMKTSSAEMKRVLNARQLALKDISNSFYGYTGYVRARLFMLDVANAITAYGRQNIEKTKKLVEEKFSAKVVYGDTDSIFVKTTTTNLDEAKVIGEEISDFITKQLGGYLELEFEKIYRTFLILTKKRYVGWSFRKEGDEWKDSIEMKGIETVRRDWCPLVSEIMKEVINIILKEGDVQKAMVSVRKVIDDLKQGKVDLDKLTVIKSITKNVESYDGILPHIELARKMSVRNPQDPPKIGDRIGFVIIRGNQLLSKRAEDPAYIKKNNLEIDSDYYIRQQLIPPIERIFSSLNISKNELVGLGRQTSLDDIINGSKPHVKRQISVLYTKTNQLNNWEEFLCTKCKKTYKSMPLRGSCICGGELKIGCNGSIGDKVKLQK